MNLIGGFISENVCLNFTRPSISYRPGHGAPTQDIRKKKFTEHQINKGLTRSQSSFSLDDSNDFLSPPNLPVGKFNSELDLQDGVSHLTKIIVQKLSQRFIPWLRFVNG